MQIFILFILGLLMGSFANVCIYRWPRDLSVIWPSRSFCPWCRVQIAWYENIPILSFLAMKGQCLHCKSRISRRYPIIECLVGVLWLMCFILGEIKGFPGLFIVAAGFFMFSLVVSSMTDIDWRIIPDEITLLMAAISLIAMTSNPLLDLGSSPTIITKIAQATIGSLIGGGILYILRWVGFLVKKQEVMGWGDIKWLASLGLFLGPEGVIITIFWASLLGTCMIMPLLVAKKIKIQHFLPFGPLLNLGASIFFLMRLAKL